MTQFVLVMTHLPDQCPTANATVQKLFQGVAKDLPLLSKELGGKILAGPLISTDHREFAIGEANGVDAVRDFLLESALIQWNNVEVLPAVNAEEANKELEKLRPIY